MFAELLLDELKKLNQKKDETPNTPEQLRAALNVFQEKNTFKVGDIVDWKPGMKNKKSSGPFIVSHVFDNPVFGNTNDSGSLYFHEPLDVKLAYVDVDGYLVEYAYDSRRFQHYTQKK